MLDSAVLPNPFMRFAESANRGDAKKLLEAYLGCTDPQSRVALEPYVRRALSVAALNGKALEIAPFFEHPEKLSAGILDEADRQLAAAMSICVGLLDFDTAQTVYELHYVPECHKLSAAVIMKTRLGFPLDYKDIEEKIPRLLARKNIDQKVREAAQRALNNALPDSKGRQRRAMPGPASQAPEPKPILIPRK